MTFNQLHRGSCYLIFFPFWLNYIWTSVTYDTKLHEDCLSNVYTLSSSAHIWWNSKDDRLLLTRNFWNVKDGFKLFREASFVPPPLLIQTVSVCCTGKVDGHASLPVFLKNFWAKLDFLSRNIYHFLSAGDCRHRNRLVSVVFKLCKRIICPIRMTSFYNFDFGLKELKPRITLFLGIWKGFGIILWKKGQDVNRRWIFRL